MKVHEYLERLTQGVTEAEFVREYPCPVLLELEAGGGPETTDAGVTEKLDAAAIRRQSLSSRDARVFVLRERKRGQPLRVGRHPDCDLIVEHPSVSKEHARFHLGPAGVEVEDLGSTNGTWINHHQLERGGRAKLGSDDLICFGRANLLHYLEPAGLYSYLKLLQRFAL